MKSSSIERRSDFFHRFEHRPRQLLESFGAQAQRATRQTISFESPEAKFRRRNKIFSDPNSARAIFMQRIRTDVGGELRERIPTSPEIFGFVDHPFFTSRDKRTVACDQK